MKMKTKIVNIDALAAICGHFEDRDGGYECDHPDNDQYPGQCYSCSCPLAHMCEFQDIEEYAPEMKEDYADDGECDSAELVVYHYEDGDPIGERL